MEVTPTRLALSILVALIAAGLPAVISLYRGVDILAVQSIFAIISGVVLGVLFLGLSLRRSLLRWLEGQLRPRLREEMYSEIQEVATSEARRRLEHDLYQKLGIVKIFYSFRDCEAEVVQALEQSHMAKIFIQVGRTVFMTDSFWQTVTDLQMREQADIRILHAGPMSPYLSEQVAMIRGSSYAEWEAELELAASRIEGVSKTPEGHLDARQHNEPFFWRAFLCEEHGYLQPYMYDRDNSENAPVLKVTRFEMNEGVSTRTAKVPSLYTTFENYFDAKWEEGTPTVGSLEEVIPRGEVVAVAGVVRRDQFFVFAVPERYLVRDATEVAFHAIGGKVEDGEEPMEALLREAREEMGLPVEIKSSSSTRHFYGGAEIHHRLRLRDNPSPYAVYRRSRAADPNFEDEEVLWLVGYEANLKTKGYPAPTGEVAALVYLTGDMLKRTMESRRCSYGEIQAATDGSRVVVRSDVDFPFETFAVPRGLALIAAVRHEHRWMGRLDRR